MRAVRIRFKKCGRAKYISHLDLNRLMTRAVRRAKLPLWYTEGFNPHPYLSFPMPLSLGHESDAEVLDIKIVGEISNDEIKRCLNEVLSEGIEVTDVYEPFCNIHEIAYAKYLICADFDSEESAKTAAESAEKLVESGNIIAEKTGKKGRDKIVKQINICENIKSFSVKNQQKKLVISVVLTAGESNNINPSLLTGAFSALDMFKDTLFSIRREALLTKDGSVFM